MTLTSQIVFSAIKVLIRLLCRVDDAQLSQVPDQGPLIIVANHVNFLEVPLIYTHLRPRPLTGFAKVEAWDNPIIGTLFSMGGAIPIYRGEANVGAFRQALKALEAGHILGVAPEGTRSGHGRLQRGLPGIVLLALHSGAPSWAPEIRSFSRNGTPPKRPAGISTAAASRARSYTLWITALTCGFSASIRPIASSTSSAGVISLSRTKPARPSPSYWSYSRKLLILFLHC